MYGSVVKYMELRGLWVHTDLRRQRSREANTCSVGRSDYAAGASHSFVTVQDRMDVEPRILVGNRKRFQRYSSVLLFSLLLLSLLLY
jgi:hypothetical protein